MAVMLVFNMNFYYIYIFNMIFELRCDIALNQGGLYTIKLALRCFSLAYDFVPNIFYARQRCMV